MRVNYVNFLKLCKILVAKYIDGCLRFKHFHDSFSVPQPEESKRSREKDLFGTDFFSFHERY